MISVGDGEGLGKRPKPRVLPSKLRPGEGVFREGVSLWIMFPSLLVGLPRASQGLQVRLVPKVTERTCKASICRKDFGVGLRIDSGSPGPWRIQGMSWKAFRDLFVPIRSVPFLIPTVCG